MTQFKLVYERAGGHVHYSIFVRTLPTETWAKSGNGCLSLAEWEAFSRIVRDHEAFILRDKT